ncbi:MAG TPA: class I SAM-dependent methyltransferase [Opitutaceae bacterium]
MFKKISSGLEAAARLLLWVVIYARKTVHRLRAHGPRRTAVLVLGSLRDVSAWVAEEWFDYVSGVDTTGRELLYRADGPPDSNPDYLDYQPTPVRTVRALLNQLNPHVGSSTFVDFGSGKGRVLLIASQFNFRRVIGVEFDEKLHRTASENIRTFRGRRRCADVTSVLGRAEEFVLPPGDLVLYFFHPFEAAVLERTLQNVSRSYRENPRRILLVFFRHNHAAVVERFAEFRRLAVEPLPFDLVRLSSDYRDVGGKPYGTAVFLAG